MAFITIAEAIYTPNGYLDVIETSKLIGRTTDDVLSYLSNAGHIKIQTCLYHTHPSILVEETSLISQSIKVRPAFNDRRGCQLEQLLISKATIDAMIAHPNSNTNGDTTGQSKEEGEKHTDTAKENTIIK